MPRGWVQNRELRQCSVKHCFGEPIAKGLCDKHRKRLAKHGSVDVGHPEDWGKREKHPLYGQWNWIKRSKKSPICDRWMDFWKFVKDMSPRPSEGHVLRRVDINSSYSKENCVWVEKVIQKQKTETEKEYRRRYAKEHRKIRPDIHKAQNLKKNFGITLADYVVMHVAQNGLCAICKKTEHHINPSTGKPRDLAVDHCHATGKIRGLLCSMCNTALGKFKDSEALLQSAIEYLKKA